ncbi:glycoside hydrolase superfamily [Penicillium malachiteum]|uniref:glycoside hydrolase superfamily n=1 Tax=Penicillium malachiteum TaxID=1324776 RepID=UPI0025470886|nr:glycoside hydrolase superfamily [Penicillium malachiteum]KAJ5730951.1 glycoside hydrolase superfamily [Penicillium malachiteum]
MSYLIGGLVGTLCLFDAVSAASIAEWKTRSVYQTMTDRFARTDGSTTSPCNTTAGLYCGGTWQGTIDKLDYIQGMGFDAVMISPIIQNLEGHVEYGEAYHGYWPLDLYSLNSHFGTSQDLLDLGQALHDRGMYLMMDTVINNMAYMTNGSNPATSIDYSVFTPFNNEDYFHSYCPIINWSNYTQAQLCQTGDNQTALPDLFTEHEDVQSLLLNWTLNTMSKYSIDGLRIDAAKSVTPSFLRKYQDQIGGFMTGEVMESSVSIICDYQNEYIGSLPNYPVYYAMLSAFTKGITADLALAVNNMKAACSDVAALVSFSENHDVARFASFTDDLSLAKNAITFTMLFDGVPFIYQGQEQHLNGSTTPSNREAVWLSNYDNSTELYSLITTLNMIRKHAHRMDNSYMDHQTSNIYQGGSELGFRKGIEGRQVIMLLSTQGVNAKPYDVNLWVSYNAGVNVTEVLNCKTYLVDGDGDLTVDMVEGLPRVFFPTELMDGSGLCGYPSVNLTFADIMTGSGSLKTSLAAGGIHITPQALGMTLFLTFMFIIF